MKAVFKYPIDVQDRIVLRLPEGAEILSVQTQRGVICAWVLVDTDKPLEDRVLHIYGTGHEVTEPEDMMLSFVGTFQLANGDLVFHLFEEWPL